MFSIKSPHGVGLMMTQAKAVTFSRFWQCQCNNTAETKKQIAFDLDAKALEMYYPSEGWNNAYEVIKCQDKEI